MCFIEFVGYTCGHTSLPVLRPCPLTTASHTFPACSRRGDKTFFAGEMCSACQKIVHSRATQIEEYEHRFMHERGVCGCETVFPYLIRPRVIGSCDGGGNEHAVTSYHAGDSHGRTDVWAGDGADSTSETSEIPETTEIQLPPLLCEAIDPGGRTTVSVRLSSLYAAEWVADHRARHDTGLCQCRVDFRTYKEAKCDEIERSEVGTGETQAENDTGASRSLRRAVSMSVISSSSGSEEITTPVRQLTRSSSHDDFSYFLAGDGQQANASKGLVTAAGALQDALYDAQGSQDHVVQEDGFVVAHTPITPLPSKSVRYGGAVFAEVPEYLRLMGPFLSQPSPYAPGSSDQAMMLDCVLDETGGELTLVEGHRNEGFSRGADLVQNQSRQSSGRPRARTMANMKEHHEQQARMRVPLVGFPIGAGPEGVSHGIPWRNRPSCWRRS
ncbi:hypothetical protein SPBR_07316 [Sporothrix brasiliensis 5110]|uniref:Uncharacterized protein n=1 Tax=Sporothrix brasiliensis 5110 TaxID=1398154 RepID=A0A0C2EQ53_9PEZI|nr:uncharacterized protein SPBR_07316 [Sporothrix brasiliensis 5110]KIH88459.1 hypothetical protein SPBR_07316 [Sporothrix brasiliensis 5110]